MMHDNPTPERLNDDSCAPIAGLAVGDKGKGIQRGRRGAYTPRGLRIKAYELVLQPRQQGLTYRQIIAEVE